MYRVKQEYKNAKADLIGQLEKAKAASDELIGQVEKEKGRSAKVIGQLERERAESSKLISQLEWEKAESVKLIGQMEQEKAESAKLLGQAEQEKVESAKLSVRLQEMERIQTGREQELNLVYKLIYFLSLLLFLAVRAWAIATVFALYILLSHDCVCLGSEEDGFCGASI